MFVILKARSSLSGTVRSRSIVNAETIALSRKASSNSKPWEDNDSQKSYTVPVLGAAVIGMGIAGGALYVYYPELFSSYLGARVEAPSLKAARSNSSSAQSKPAAQETNAAERREWEKTSAGAAVFHRQLDSFRNELEENATTILKSIDQSSVDEMSLETFLQLYYKRFLLSLQLLQLLTKSHEVNKKLKNIGTTKGGDTEIQNQAIAAREKLLSSWSELYGDFSKLSFPPMEEEKLQDHWKKYYSHVSKHLDYSSSYQAFSKSVSQRWVPSDEQESALMDKIMEVCRRLQQLECLLVERFDHSKKPASKSADLEGISLDEDQRGTVDEIVKSKVEEVKENFEIEFNHKVAEEKKRLNIQLGEEFNDKLQTMKVEYAQKLAETLAKLHAIESAVDEKASSQKRALFSHYMWLACESLRSQLFRDVEIGFCSERATALDKLLKPLHQFTRKIELVNADEKNPFVTSVLASVPEIARSRGVYTEDMLKLRFNRVVKTCYRLADVNEERNSVYAHILSNVKAALTIRKIKDVPLDIDLGSVDNYSLLQYAECALERGDVGVCVKILNHLKGKPAEIVRDWLNEARLFLETKQAAHCLSLFSTATGFSAAPLS